MSHSFEETMEEAGMHDPDETSGANHEDPRSSGRGWDDEDQDRGRSDRSAARVAGQQGWSSAKSWTSKKVRQAREKASDNELSAAALEGVDDAVAKVRQKSADLGGAALDRSRKHLGLADLTDELERNLETAAMVIAAQQERIERLESRVKALEGRS